MLNFGILGCGKYGSLLKSKLEKLGHILWEIDSNTDYQAKPNPDWVVISTPNIFHYEQAIYYLEKQVNVFLEKPPVLSVKALEHLIDLANKYGSSLYFSDVFLYRDDIKKLLSFSSNAQSVNFKWSKSTSNDTTSVLYRFAYHHLYLIYRYVDKVSPNYKIIEADFTNLKNIKFSIVVDGKIFNNSYALGPDVISQHIAFGKDITIAKISSDPISSMLSYILEDNTNYEINHKSALWTLTILEELKRNYFPKVEVIGGGIFGCVSAIELANRGANVTLFEKNNDIICETSAINQYRVHRGYHYPRSLETSIECRNTSSKFNKYFKRAILPSEITHIYAISKKNSLTSAKGYLDFLDRLQLEYRIVEPLPNTDLTVQVVEDLYDPEILKQLIHERLRGAGVNVILNNLRKKEQISPETFTISATYSGENLMTERPEIFQYELCEKPVLKLPDDYKKKSIVIMDGPFMCIDPLGSSGHHVMGNVVHAIHSSNVGFEPTIPEGYKELLNNGIISNPKHTNIDLFIESATEYFPNIEKAKYIGSMFTIRVVQANREHDDARPTLVTEKAKNFVSIFSGKVCTSISAANQVADLFEMNRSVTKE